VDNPVVIDQFYQDRGSRATAYDSLAKGGRFRSMPETLSYHGTATDVGASLSGLDLQQGAVAINNITFTNLKGTSSRSTAVACQCNTPYSCRGIHVRFMKITGPGGREAVARCLNVQGDTYGYIYPKIPCLLQ
jgi:hypothetical protein